jgi:hypothetical protein
MNQPVRRKTDADATETNQLDVTYSVENFFVVQHLTLLSTIGDKKPAQIRGYSPYPQSSRTATWRRCAAGALVSLVAIQRRSARGASIDQSALQGNWC